MSKAILCTSQYNEQWFQNFLILFSIYFCHAGFCLTACVSLYLIFLSNIIQIFPVFLSFQEEGTWAIPRLIFRISLWLFSIAFLITSIFYAYFWSLTPYFHKNTYHTSKILPLGTRDHYFISKVTIVFLTCTTNKLVHPSATSFVCHPNVQSLSLVEVLCNSAPQTFVFTALNNLVPSVNFIISAVTSFYT